MDMYPVAVPLNALGLDACSEYVRVHACDYVL